jgi:hypothetical protein
MSLHKFALVAVFAFAGLLSACAKPTPIPVVPTQANISPEDIVNTNDLLHVLQQQGVTAQLSGDVAVPFFQVQGQVMRIEQGDVNVYDFQNKTRMDAATQKLITDGQILDNLVPSWSEQPHIWTKGNLIVFYDGTDTAVISSLGGVLGKEIPIRSGAASGG